MKRRCLSLFGLLFGVLFNLAAQTAGPNNAGTGANVTGIGTVAWSNPGNITASDGNRASAANGVSNYLRVSNFGFSLPANANPIGIQVDIQRRGRASSAVDQGTWLHTGMSGGLGFCTGTRGTTGGNCTSGQIPTGTSCSSSLLSNYNGSTTYSYTLPASGTSRMMVVIVAFENTDNSFSTPCTGTNNTNLSVTSVTYNGTAMIQASFQERAGASTRNSIGVYYLLDAALPANGTTANIVVTKSRSAGSQAWSDEYIEFVSANTFSNVWQSTPFDVTGATAGANSLAFTTQTPRSGDMALVTATGNTPPGGSAVASAGAGDWNALGSFTEQRDAFANNRGCSCGAQFSVQTRSYSVAAAGAALTPTITGGSSHGRIVGVYMVIKSARVFDNGVQLTQGGSLAGTDLRLGNTSEPLSWPDNDAYQSYGSLASIAWGGTWTRATINNTGFGVSITADANNATAEVNHVRISVAYTIILQTHLGTFEVVQVQTRTVSTFSVWADTEETHLFTLERSPNGTDFVPVGQLEWRSVIGANRRFEIPDPLAWKGTMYYRLRTDVLGKAPWYSRTVSLSNSKETPPQIYVWPQPAKETFHVQSNGETVVSCAVYSLNGSEMATQIAPVGEGEYVVRPPDGVQWLPGIYVLKVAVGDQTICSKLVIE